MRHDGAQHVGQDTIAGTTCRHRLSGQSLGHDPIAHLLRPSPARVSLCRGEAIGHLRELRSMVLNRIMKVRSHIFDLLFAVGASIS